MSDTVNAIVRSRNIGVNDVYVYPVTVNNGITYTAGEGHKLGRAINVKISEKFSTEKLYSDDTVEDTIESFEGCEIEIEVNKLSPQDLAQLIDVEYKDGYLLASGTDSAKEIALQFRSKCKNGKAEFFTYYCGKLSDRPSLEYSTKKDKIETKTNTVKFEFYEREKVEDNGKNLYKLVVDQSNLVDADTSASTAISKWFESVQEYTPKA